MQEIKRVRVGDVVKVRGVYRTITAIFDIDGKMTAELTRDVNGLADVTYKACCDLENKGYEIIRGMRLS